MTSTVKYISDLEQGDMARVHYPYGRPELVKVAKTTKTTIQVTTKSGPMTFNRTNGREWGAGENYHLRYSSLHLLKY